MPNRQTTRIGVLSTQDSPYLLDLRRAASLSARPTEVELLKFNDLQSRIGLEPDFDVGVRTSSEKAVVSDVDAVIVRSMPLGSLEQVIFRMDCLQIWESSNVPVINPPRSLEVAIDKWLTLHRLHQVGVPVPATIACQTRAAAMEAFELLGGDVLVKPLFGGEGRGIVRLQNADMAWRVLGTLQQIGQVLYLQQYCHHLGYDIRVLFIGERVFSIKRHAVGGAWRTNLSQGSVPESHKLSETEMELARKSAEAVGGSILGVDLLPCCDGRLLVLEVNAVPGWRGLAKALDVDIATQVINHMHCCINTR